MVLSSSNGVYETVDGGVNWTLLHAGSASSMVMIVNAGPPATIQLIVGYYGSGLWTSTRNGTTWSTWTQIASAAFPTSFGRIALGQSKNNPQNIYAAFSFFDGGIAGIVKTSNGGLAWSPVTPPLSDSIDTTSTFGGADNHTHTVHIPQADLAAPAAHTYTTSSAGTPAHTHTISLTLAEMQLLAAGSGSVTKITNPDATGHQHFFTLDRRISRQTWYNFHISVHPNDPNTVYYGETALWKTTTGNAPWTDSTCLCF